MKRQKPFEKRHEYVRDAEKDLACALTSLHEGNLVRAALNGALAMVRITGAMTEREADEMVQAAESIVALEKSRRNKDGQTKTGSDVLDKSDGADAQRGVDGCQR